MLDELIGWLSPLLVAVLMIGWYLSFSASRLDRLHHKVESSWAALDSQLVRRTAAATEAATVLDPASGVMVAGAAAEALAGEDEVLEEVQNDLTRALVLALDDPEAVAHLRRDPRADAVLETLAAACRRVQLARRFHNEAVAQTQRVRRKRVVRWARLAGRAPWPRMIEMDDSTPRGLAG